MEIIPVVIPGSKTAQEAVRPGNVTGGEKLQELEDAAAEAIGKNFIRASVQEVEKSMELLEEWKIRPSQELSAELSELKEIYRSLLHNIRENYSGPVLGQQLERLHDLLLDIVGKEGLLRYPELLSFLGQFGDPGADEVLQYFVLKNIMGSDVSLRQSQEMRADTGRGGLAGSGRGDSRGQTGFSGGQTLKRTDVQPQEGILYYKGLGRNIHKVNKYQEQVRNTELSVLEILTRADCSRIRGKSYSGYDIEIAERFIKYFENGGNVLSRLHLAEGNEILAGFLLAENTLKAEVCTGCVGMGKSMGQDIRQAFRKLTESWLNRLEESGAAKAAPAAGVLPDVRKIRKVYYQVLQIFHKLKSPGKALGAGLEYAVKELYSESRAGRVKKKNRSGGSLFDGLVSGNSEKAAWEKGGRMLERDWEKFLVSIGGENIPFLQWAFSIQSPWLALEEPQDAAGPSGRFHPGMLLGILGIAVIIALVIIIGNM